MVNNLIDLGKLNNAALIYNPCTFNQISDLDIHMTIPERQKNCISPLNGTTNLKCNLEKRSNNLKQQVMQQM